MNSPNPRLAGLWVAQYPSRVPGGVPCRACGALVSGRAAYRLAERPPARRFGGARPHPVAGHLCRECRKALGPTHKAHYFTRIEGNAQKAPG